MRKLFLFVLLATSLHSQAQELYFPPLLGSTWETTTPEQLQWCTDTLPHLYDFLDSTNTKAFLLLKDGKIVLEWYFGTFTQDSTWYWASAGKSLTAFLVGLAQEQGFINIDASSQTYLGEGWSSLTPSQESAITVRHHLSMTTGLDDTAGASDCTDPACLTYLAQPGERWAYHNAPYTLLDNVLLGASGNNATQWVFNELTLNTGITGAFINVEYNNVFFSKARSMARFGLLMLANGTWNGNTIMSDVEYFQSMITPSQTLNQSYGYLWWLNGQSSFMIPQTQFVFPGSLMPDAPDEIYAAEGKNGQMINVVPTQGLVMVRMGDNPDTGLISTTYNSRIWTYLNQVLCTPTNTVSDHILTNMRPFPNPAVSDLWLNVSAPTDYAIVNMMGQCLQKGSTVGHINIAALSAGTYLLQLNQGEASSAFSFVKSE
jgi:CubicO group peptidase (beta-lactamase class C family)